MNNKFQPVNEFAREIGKKTEYILDGLINVPIEKRENILKDNLGGNPLIKYCHNTINTIALHHQTNQNYNIATIVVNSYYCDRSGKL